MWSNNKADAGDNSVTIDKIGKYFDALDRDGNGTIDDGDLMLIGATFGVMPDNNEEARIPILAKLASEGFPMTEANFTGVLTRDGFIKYVLDRSSTGEIKDDYEVLVSMILGIFNMDKDDQLVVPYEFHYFYVASGLYGCDEKTAFNALDRNDNGELDHEELIEGAGGYFTSNDPKDPGRWLYCWQSSYC